MKPKAQTNSRQTITERRLQSETGKPQSKIPRPGLCYETQSTNQQQANHYGAALAIRNRQTTIKNPPSGSLL
ncbi:MAG TPA: hypothetical protein PKE07_14840, partial [Lacibacter sp.]|nr:hypothetical protein [Lacibacter sp.]